MFQVGSVDSPLEFYNVFGLGRAWRSGKSCKHEGGELEYLRKTNNSRILGVGSPRVRRVFLSITMVSYGFNIIFSIIIMGS